MLVRKMVKINAVCIVTTRRQTREQNQRLQEVTEVTVSHA
jgi:hypothetical protein